MSRKIKDIKRLMTREIPILSRACGGGITLADVCRASLGGLVVIGLIGAFCLVCAVLRMGTL